MPFPVILNKFMREHFRRISLCRVSFEQHCSDVLVHHWDVTSLKNYESHIDASLSRQPLVKGERLVRTEMNAVITNVAQLTR